MAENKKYYWLKLKEDFFEEKQIKYLRRLPDGDKLVITYLKMQLKSLKTEGFIQYDKILPSNEEELAMILDEDINIVKLTIGALLKVNAIEVLEDGSFYMLAMQDLIGKEGQSAERVRRFREREKQKMLQCNADVTKCNTEIEKDINIEKEKDIDTNTDIAKITKCYEENIGMITPATAELLFSYLDNMNADLIIKAIKIATINNKRTGRYIQGILNDWSRKGIKTLLDVENAEKDFKKTKKEKDTKEETEEEAIQRKLAELRGGVFN